MHCPSKAIFHHELCDDEVRALFRFSFYANENDLFDADKRMLCKHILKSLPREVLFLSQREDELIKQMLVQGGKTLLTDWEDICAAETLVSRLWCYLEIVSDDMAMLHLADEVIAPLTEAMLSEPYHWMREQVFHIEATIHSVLYIMGFLHAMTPSQHILTTLKEENRYKAGDEVFVTRFLKASFDYMPDILGNTVLVHPGLTDLDAVLDGIAHMKRDESLLFGNEAVLGAMSGMLPEEKAACLAMQGALHDAIRPEYDEDDVVEDLKIMAKQGASLSDMKEVMAAALCTLPTKQMNNALIQLHVQVVRWVGMPSAVLN